MVIDLPRWENHRHKKGAEIVNRAGPYGAGPWLELGSGIGNNTFPLSEKIGLVIRPGGTFILVEYQTSQSVPWIPFPLPKTSAFRQLRKEKFESIKSRHETSRYYILGSQKRTTAS
ncbi:MAG: hypothetical protein ACXAB4_06780 [Candidatus Hodarchaeales archaeon]|jgi:hypothetical protein